MEVQCARTPTSPHLIHFVQKGGKERWSEDILGPERHLYPKAHAQVYARVGVEEGERCGRGMAVTTSEVLGWGRSQPIRTQAPQALLLRTQALGDLGRQGGGEPGHRLIVVSAFGFKD